MGTATQVVGTRVDRITAHLLQYSDEHGSADREEIQMGMKQVGLACDGWQGGGTGGACVD